MYSRVGVRQGEFEVRALETTTYKICFKNDVDASRSHKRVSFHLHSDDPFAEAASGKAPLQADDLNDMEIALMTLSQSVVAVSDQLDYANIQQILHYQMTESTHSRVFWYSLFETTVLIGVTVWQIYYLTNFFKERR